MFDDNFLEDQYDELRHDSIQLIKYIIDNDYGKETIFYDSPNKWYSRLKGGYITTQEATQWAIDIVEISGDFLEIEAQ